MANQQLWTLHEAVVLLDAYLQVLSGNEERKQAVADVSKKLRQMAMNKSVIIDDIYRNNNGISFQMASMESAFRGRTVLKPASKLFSEVVALYKSDYHQYRRILEEAIEMCAPNITMAEEYANWLANKVNPETLSKLYLLYDDIGKFMRRYKIVSEPILHVTDISLIRKIQREIEQNKLFKIQHKGDLYYCGLALRYYLQFLSEHAITENSNSIASTTYVPSPESAPLASQHDEAEGGIALYKDYIIQVLEESGASYVDHRDNLGCLWVIGDSSTQSVISKLKQLKISFHYKPEGSRATKGKSAWWTKDRLPIEQVTSQNLPALSTSVANQQDSATDPQITMLWKFDQPNEENDFRRMTPVKLLYFGEEYACKDWSSLFIQALKCLQEDYPAIIKGLVGVKLEAISRIALSGSADTYKLENPTKISQGIFVDIAFQCSEYVLILRTIMNKCNMDFENLEVQYIEAPGYSTEKSNCNNNATNNDSIEPNSQAVPMSTTLKHIVNPVSCKENFENWMIKDMGLAVRSAQSYSSAVNTAGQYAAQLGISDKELFSMVDPALVHQVCSKLLANQEFAAMNSNQHNRYSAALSKYLEYCNTVSGGEFVAPPTKTLTDLEMAVKKSRIAFIAWAQEQKMHQGAILAYLSSIKKCSEFARQHGYIAVEHILLIEDADSLENILLGMRKDAEFEAFNKEQLKRPVSAMNKLIAFRRASGNPVEIATNVTPSVKPAEKPAQRLPASVTTSAIDPLVKERYTAILAENFEDGFRPAKAIDRNRFRMYYNDMFGQELSEDDEKLVRTLMKVGTLRDERIFVKDEMEQKDLLEEINETIMDTLKSGASCIYLECLFARFQDQLAEMLHIYNVDSLESVLFSSGKRNYFKRYNYLFGYSKEPAPARDVVEYMKNAHLPVTYSEIENGLWYIPLDKIKHTLVTTSGIVNVASEAYLYAPNLPVSENELRQITDLICHALLQRSYISDVELMQLIEEHCPSVLMNTPDYPMWGLRNALAYLLREKFSFKGAIISDKDEEISMAEVFTDFCQRSEHITVDELRNFANEMNTVIYWDSVYCEMVRINQNEFVRRDQIHFDVERTDAVLDSLVQSAYMPIKTISLFLHFPTIDVPWNNFVLESYVANYSKKFRLLHACYTATDCCGSIVRQESGIADYRTLIVDVLTKNTGWKTQKTHFSF